MSALDRFYYILISILTTGRWRFVLILFWAPVFLKGSYVITGFSKVCLFSHLGDRLLVSPNFSHEVGAPQWSRTDRARFLGGHKWGKSLRGPARGKLDGVIRHILECENGNWMKNSFLREWSSWYPAWLGVLGVNMNYRQFLDVNCAINLRESGIASPPLGGLSFVEFFITFVHTPITKNVEFRTINFGQKNRYLGQIFRAKYLPNFLWFSLNFGTLSRFGSSYWKNWASLYPLLKIS